MRRMLWGVGFTALVLGLAACSVARAAMPAVEAPPVAVRLIEFRLEMPTSIPAGTTSLSVTNAGQMPHNFEIKSITEEEDPVEQPLPPNLQPGETRTFPVALTPGTYMAECPLFDHSDRGMKLQVTVTP